MKTYTKNYRPETPLQIVWAMILRRKILVISTFVILFFLPIAYLTTRYQSKTEAAWLDDQWGYRKSITVTNNTTQETNVYISTTLDTSDTTRFQGDCGDLRFTSANGKAYPYYIVSGCTTASTVIHVKLDVFPAGVQIIYYYYGNPSAQNGFSSADFSTVASNYSIGALGNEEKSLGPVAYWKFDEGYGTTVNNSSTNGSNGSFSGAPTWKSEDQCISGKCLYFDGSDDHITVNETYSLKQNNSWSIAAWIKPHATSSFDKIVVGKQGWHGGLLWWNSDVAFFIRTDVGASYSISHTPVTNQWTYYVATYETGTGIMKLYANGKFVNQTTFSGTMLNYGDSLMIGGSGTASYHSNVTVDDIKIYNYDRTATQIKSDYNSQGTVKGSSVQIGSKNPLESFSQGLVGYWKMDEAAGAGSTLTDSSGNANTGTAVLWGGGNTSTDSAHVAGKFGNSFSFDGGDDYITPASSIVMTGAGSTLSLWFKVNAFGGMFVGKAADNDTYIYPSNSTTINVQTDTISTEKTFTVPTMSTGTWYHLVVTRDNNTTHVYLNGTESTSGGQSQTPDLTINQFGRYSNYAGYWYNGMLDELRLYNRALSPREVRDLYNWSAGPVGYYKLDEGSGTSSVNDSSGNGNTATMNGLTSSDWVSGKFGKGLQFNNSDYLNVSVNSWIRQAEYITIGGWYYHTGDTTGAPWGIMTGTGVGSDDGFWWHVKYPGNALYLRTEDNIHGESDGTGTPFVTAGNWYYLTTIVGTNKFDVYVNGVLYWSWTPNSSFDWPSINSDTAYLYIGKSYTADNSVNGIVDDVKVYNYARNSKQIVEDMNAGHPAGGSPVGSQVGYWKMDEGYGTTTNNSGNGGSTYNATLASSPNTPTWNNEGKFGKSLSFDGSNDYATINASLPTLTEGSISMWVKRTATTGTYQMLFTDSGSQFEMTWNNATNLQFYVNNVAVNTTSASGLNTWYHLAGTFSETGNYQRIYVNGILANSSTYPGDATTATRYFGSRAGSYPFAGLIDEIKVYNAALTSDEIALDYNRGASMVLGTMSDTSGLSGGSIASSSATASYCVPGGTDSCNPPVGEWNFEEGSGINVNDISGHGYAGTLTGSPTWTQGKYGKGVNFISNDYMNLASPYLDLGSNWTIESWFKYPFPSGDCNTLTRGNAGDHQVIIDCGGTLLGTFDNVGGSGFHSSGFNTNTLTNGWHHLVAVGTGSNTLFYIDGKYVGTATYQSTSDIRSIGAYFGGSQPFGTIDQVRIYDYARTQAQIAYDYNRGAPIAHWKFDECQGITANDSSGNGNSGTITIGATVPQSSVGTCTVVDTATAWYNGATGKYNSSLRFDGVDDYMTRNMSVSATDGTVAFWVKDFATGAGPYLFRSDANVRTYVGVSGTTMYFYKGNPAVQVTSTPNLTTSNWNHVVLKWWTTGGTQYAEAYANGISTGSPVTFSDTSAGSYITVGGFSQTGTQNAAGQIDDARIYNYALTPVQIKQVYNQGGGMRFGPSSGSP